MAKYSRVTAKVFGETANASLADPEISQFGSGKAGIYNGTGDVATIQSLSAWSNGWIDAVTPTQQFPPLPEMTGVHKVLSYQNAYLLQQGIPEWDSATSYYTNNFCAKDGKLYISKTNDNLNNDPESDAVNWERFASGSGLKLGQSIWSPDPLVDSDLHLYNGSQYSTGGIYADFVTNYLIPLKTAKPSRFKTEADWQTINTQYGVCGYWVLDTVNNVFRFPHIEGIIENTNTEGDLGKITEAGLPNITGTIVNALDGHTSPSSSGAFSQTTGTSVIGGYGANYVTSLTSNFNASNSNSIYGNSNTVQPQTISGYLYCVVANGQTPTQAQTDINQIATDLAGKADVDLSNCTKPYVTTTYVNGSSWYRVYSDKWCEQGGAITKNTSDTVYEVVLLKNYANTNYGLQVTDAWDVINNANAITNIKEKTTSTFKVSLQNTSSSYGASWYACGYIS